MRQVYGGKAQAMIELQRDPAVVWLRSRAFEPAAPSGARGEITRATPQVDLDAPTRIIERHREEGGKIRLEDAKRDRSRRAVAIWRSMSPSTLSAAIWQT